MNNKKRNFVVGLLSSLFIIACTAGGYTVNTNQLTVVNPNQNILGDKPYVALIRFQSTFGRANSTIVTTNVEMTQLGRRMKSGDTADIPASIGFNRYPVVARFSRDEVVNQGKSPTIYGTIVIGMEEDIVGGSLVADAIRDTASVLEESLSRHVEAPDSWGIGLGLGTVLQDVSNDLTSSSNGGGCGLFDTRACSWFKERIGDDLVGRAFYAAINIDAEYYNSLSALFDVFGGGQWPGCDHNSNPICYVRTENRTLDLTGEGQGHYRVNMVSEFTTAN